MKNRKILRIIRAALLFVIFLCLVLIIRECCLSINHRIQQEKLEEKLQTEYDRAEEGQKYPEIESISNQKIENIKQDMKMETEPVILEKYADLYEENSDLTGWLSIEGMKINYPVMQCEDDEYYLHHDFYGNEDKYGCLYVRETADVNTPGTNFVIYGHNMRDGSMFGDLDFYKEEDFFKEHSGISFDTLYEERTYEIVAVFLSRVYNEDDEVFKYYDFYEAGTLEEFQDFYGNIKSMSLYDTEVTAEYGDTFLTLSTCAYHVEDGRLVIVAKRIE